MQPRQPFVRGLHTYQGSCRCGSVRFEVDLDLSAGTGRCTCTWCTKNGWWSAHTRPDHFRLLAGDEALGPNDAPAPFDRRRCATCGILPFSRGDLPELGGAFVSINVRCLDGVDLHGVPVHWRDGLNDTWALLKVVAHVDPLAADPN